MRHAGMGELALNGPRRSTYSPTATNETSKSFLRWVQEPNETRLVSKSPTSAIHMKILWREVFGLG